MSLALKGICVESTADKFVERLVQAHCVDSVGLGQVDQLTVWLDGLRSTAARSRSVLTRHGQPGISPLTRSRHFRRIRAVVTQVPRTKKRVFTFGKGQSEGNKGMKSLLGGKGANLAEMARMGLSVPPGLTISTEACQEFQENGKKLPEGLWEEILEGLRVVENDMGAFLGDPSKPLLLSIRSGAAVSMPGMMDTVLNLGLNDEVVAGLATKSGERFAYDSYRRFLDMFGDVVMGIPHALFEEGAGRIEG